MNTMPKRRWYQFSLWIWFVGVYFIAIASRGVGLFVEVINECKGNVRVIESVTGVVANTEEMPNTEPQDSPPLDPQVEVKIDVEGQKERHRNYLLALQSVEEALDSRFQGE